MSINTRNKSSTVTRHTSQNLSKCSETSTWPGGGGNSKDNFNRTNRIVKRKIDKKFELNGDIMKHRINEILQKQKLDSNIANMVTCKSKRVPIVLITRLEESSNKRVKELVKKEIGEQIKSEPIKKLFKKTSKVLANEKPKDTQHEKNNRLPETNGNELIEKTDNNRHKNLNKFTSKLLRDDPKPVQTNSCKEKTESIKNEICESSKHVNSDSFKYFSVKIRTTKQNEIKKEVNGECKKIKDVENEIKGEVKKTLFKIKDEVKEEEKVPKSTKKSASINSSDNVDPKAISRQLLVKLKPLPLIEDDENIVGNANNAKCEEVIPCNSENASDQLYSQSCAKRLFKKNFDTEKQTSFNINCASLPESSSKSSSIDSTPSSESVVDKSQWSRTRTRKRCNSLLSDTSEIVKSSEILTKVFNIEENISSCKTDEETSKCSKDFSSLCTKRLISKKPEQSTQRYVDKKLKSNCKNFSEKFSQKTRLDRKSSTSSHSNNKKNGNVSKEQNVEKLSEPEVNPLVRKKALDSNFSVKFCSVTKQDNDTTLKYDSAMTGSLPEEKAHVTNSKKILNGNKKLHTSQKITISKSKQVDIVSCKSHKTIKHEIKNNAVGENQVKIAVEPVHKSPKDQTEQKLHSRDFLNKSHHKSTDSKVKSLKNLRINGERYLTKYRAFKSLGNTKLLRFRPKDKIPLDDSHTKNLESIHRSKDPNDASSLSNIKDGIQKALKLDRQIEFKKRGKPCTNPLKIPPKSGTQTTSVETLTETKQVTSKIKSLKKNQVEANCDIKSSLKPLTKDAPKSKVEKKAEEMYKSTGSPECSNSQLIANLELSNKNFNTKNHLIVTQSVENENKMNKTVDKNENLNEKLTVKHSVIDQTAANEHSAKSKNSYNIDSKQDDSVTSQKLLQDVANDVFSKRTRRKQAESTRSFVNSGKNLKKNCFNCFGSEPKAFDTITIKKSKENSRATRSLKSTYVDTDLKKDFIVLENTTIDHTQLDDLGAKAAVSVGIKKSIDENPLSQSNQTKKDILEMNTNLEIDAKITNIVTNDLTLSNAIQEVLISDEIHKTSNFVAKKQIVLENETLNVPKHVGRPRKKRRGRPPKLGYDSSNLQANNLKLVRRVPLFHRKTKKSELILATNSSTNHPTINEIKQDNTAKETSTSENRQVRRKPGRPKKSAFGSQISMIDHTVIFHKKKPGRRRKLALNENLYDLTSSAKKTFLTKKYDQNQIFGDNKSNILSQGLSADVETNTCQKNEDEHTRKINGLITNQFDCTKNVDDFNQKEDFSAREVEKSHIDETNESKSLESLTKTVQKRKYRRSWIGNKLKLPANSGEQDQTVVAPKRKGRPPNSLRTQLKIAKINGLQGHDSILTKDPGGIKLLNMQFTNIGKHPRRRGRPPNPLKQFKAYMESNKRLTRRASVDSSSILDTEKFKVKKNSNSFGFGEISRITRSSPNKKSSSDLFFGHTRSHRNGLRDYRIKTLRKSLKQLYESGKKNKVNSYNNAFLNFLQEKETSDDSENENDSNIVEIDEQILECVEDMLTSVTATADQAETARRLARSNGITFDNPIDCEPMENIFEETAKILSENFEPPALQKNDLVSVNGIGNDLSNDQQQDRRKYTLQELKKKCEENLTKKLEQNTVFSEFHPLGLPDDDDNQTSAERLPQSSSFDISNSSTSDSEVILRPKPSFVELNAIVHCKTCSIDFPTNRELRRHIRLEHRSPQQMNQQQRIIMKITKTDMNTHMIQPVVPCHPDEDDEENLIAVAPDKINDSHFGHVLMDGIPPITDGEIKMIVQKDKTTGYGHVVKEIKITPRAVDHSSNQLLNESIVSSSSISSSRQHLLEETPKVKKRGRPRKYPIFTESELMAKQMAAVQKESEKTEAFASEISPSSTQPQTTIISKAQIVFTVSPSPNAVEPPPLVPIQSSTPRLAFNGSRKWASKENSALFEPVESIKKQGYKNQSLHPKSIKSTKISPTEALKAFRKPKREDSHTSEKTTPVSDSSSSIMEFSPSSIMEFSPVRQSETPLEDDENVGILGTPTRRLSLSNETVTHVNDQVNTKMRSSSENLEEGSRYGITKNLVVQLTKIDMPNETPHQPPGPRCSKIKPRILFDEYIKSPLQFGSRRIGQDVSRKLLPLMSAQNTAQRSVNVAASNCSAKEDLTRQTQIIQQLEQKRLYQQQQQQQQQLLMVVNPKNQPQTQPLPPAQQFCILFIPDSLYNSDQKTADTNAQPTATLVNFQPVPDSELPNKQLVFTPTSAQQNQFVTNEAKSQSYICNNCSELLELMSNLEASTGMSDDSKSDIACPYCSKMFQSLVYLQYHIMQEHLKCTNENLCRNSSINTLRLPAIPDQPDHDIYFSFSLKCRNCYTIFSSVREINEHVMLKHKILVRFRPSIPSMPSGIELGKNGFNKNLLMQCPADCVCRVGMRSGASVLQRQQMIKRCPNAMRRLEKVDSAAYEIFNCQICKSTYIVKDDVIDHLNKTHEVACKHLCRVCLYSFKTSELLDNHGCTGATLPDKEKLLNIVVQPVNVAAAVQEQDKQQAQENAALALKPTINGLKRCNGMASLAMDMMNKRPRIINMINGKHRKRSCPKCNKKMAYKKCLHDHVADHLDHVEKAPKRLALELLKMYIDGLTDLPRLQELRELLKGFCDADGMALVDLVTIEEEELTPEERIELEKEEAREASAMAAVVNERDETMECSKCMVTFRRFVPVDAFNRSALRQQEILCDNCDPVLKTRGRKAAMSNGQLVPDSTTKDLQLSLLPYGCSGCSERFDHLLSLKKHIQATSHPSSETSIFVCEKCKRCFSSNRMLEKHYKCHHNDSAKSELVAAVESICEADHMSDASEDVFSSTETTAAIVSITPAPESTTHTESNANPVSKEPDQLLECSFCEELCSSKVSLKNHLKREHGRKASICQFCNGLLVDTSEVRHMLDNHIKCNGRPLLSSLSLCSSSSEEVAAEDVEELVRTLGKHRLKSLMMYHDFEGKCNNAVMRCPICPELFATRESCRFHYIWSHDTTCLLCDEVFRTGSVACQHKNDDHTGTSSYLWCTQRLCTAIVQGFRLDPSQSSHSLYATLASKLDGVDEIQDTPELDITLPRVAANKPAAAETLDEVVLSEDQLPDSSNMVEVVIGKDDAEDDLLCMLNLSPNYESCNSEQSRIPNAGAAPPLEEDEESHVSSPPPTPTPTAQVPSSPIVENYVQSGVCKCKLDNGEEQLVLVVTDEDLITYKDNIPGLAERISLTCDSFSLAEITEMLKAYFENASTNNQT